jgi:type IV secretion system protein VirD4
VQLRELYDANWESFLSSCAVRHFFNLNDKTTLEYVSSLFGVRSIATYSAGIAVGATPRPLINPDELRRASDNRIFTLIDQQPPTYFPKSPYYEVLEEGVDFDPNPYFKKP